MTTTRRSAETVWPYRRASRSRWCTPSTTPSAIASRGRVSASTCSPPSCRWLSGSGQSRSSRASGPPRARPSPSSSARWPSSTARCISSTSTARGWPGPTSRACSPSPPGSCSRPAPPSSRAPPRRGRGRPAPPWAPPVPRSRRPAPAVHGHRRRTGITETHKFREHVGPPPGSDYREVAFDASDGVHLSGWYRPTRNGATVLVVHGGGGDRSGAVPTPAPRPPRLRRAAPRRPRPRPQRGPQNTFGWGWDQGRRRRDRLPEDPPGGRSRAHRRPRPLDRRRRADPGAGQGMGLRASWPTGRPQSPSRTGAACRASRAMTPFFAAEFATVRITSGARSGPPLEDMVRRVTAPLLLVSGGRAEEYDFNVNYDRGRQPPRRALEPAGGGPHGRDPRRGARVRAPRDGLLRRGPLTAPRVGASAPGR